MENEEREIRLKCKKCPYHFLTDVGGCCHLLNFVKVQGLLDKEKYPAHLC
jgi:hypothetical protein